MNPHGPVASGGERGYRQRAIDDKKETETARLFFTTLLTLPNRRCFRIQERYSGAGRRRATASSVARLRRQMLSIRYTLTGRNLNITDGLASFAARKRKVPEFGRPDILQDCVSESGSA